MTEATTVASVQAKSQNQPPLACKLRPKEVVGRQGPIPNMGEVELENRSDAPIEIEYTMTPLQFFELEHSDSGFRILYLGAQHIASGRTGE